MFPSNSFPPVFATHLLHGVKKDVWLLLTDSSGHTEVSFLLLKQLKVVPVHQLPSILLYIQECAKLFSEGKIQLI